MTESQSGRREPCTLPSVYFCQVLHKLQILCTFCSICFPAPTVHRTADGPLLSRDRNEFSVWLVWRSTIRLSKFWFPEGALAFPPLANVTSQITSFAAQNDLRPLDYYLALVYLSAFVGKFDCQWYQQTHQADWLVQIARRVKYS